MEFSWYTKLGIALALVAAVAAWIAGPGCASPGAGSGGADIDWRSQRKKEGRLRVTVTRTNYNGWTDAIIMRGASTEVIIVPAIGRIMQFQFVGEPGPFWENRALDGQV